MNKSRSVLSSRLKYLYTRFKNKDITLYDYYQIRPDILAEKLKENITFDGKNWTVSDFGCNFNYIEYIKTVSGKNPIVIGYSDGLVLEVK